MNTRTVTISALFLRTIGYEVSFYIDSRKLYSYTSENMCALAAMIEIFMKKETIPTEEYLNTIFGDTL